MTQTPKDSLQSFSNAQPVPKEDQSLGQAVSQEGNIQPKQVTGVPQQMNEPQVQQVVETGGASTQPQVGLAPQHQQTKESVVFQQPSEQKTVSKEKKGKGFCNVTSCFIGSCVGCLVILIVLILLGIFAAPMLAKMLNRVINPGVEVPEVNEVSLDDLNSNIDQILTKSGEQIIIVSEDEFNTLLKQKYGDVTDTAVSMDIRTDLEQDTAQVLIRFVDWMPWAVITVVNDQEGNVSTTSIKLGPIDASSYFNDAIQERIQNEGSDYSQGMDIPSLFANVIFGDNVNAINVKSINFLKDEVKIAVEIIDIEDSQDL